MKQPSLVVHSHDGPGYKYRMKWTWEMLPGASAGDIVNWVLHANGGQFGARRQRLENIVVNCPGTPGSLLIGGTGSPDLNIGKAATSARSGSWPARWPAQQGVATGGVSKSFCAELAKTAGCNVIASAATQRVNVGFYLRGCPWGCIDDYEGLTYRFKPAGGHTYHVS